MTHVATTELQANLPAVLRKVPRGGRVALRNSRGKDVAVLVSAEDVALMERLIEEEEDRIDGAECGRILERIASGEEKTVPWAEAERRLAEEAEDREDVRLYRQAKREMARSGEKPIPWEQVKQELGLD
jgi:prevent-host-death family protein